MEVAPRSGVGRWIQTAPGGRRGFREPPRGHTAEWVGPACAGRTRHEPASSPCTTSFQEQRGTAAAGGTGLEPAAMPHRGDLDDVGRAAGPPFRVPPALAGPAETGPRHARCRGPAALPGYTLLPFELAPDLQDPCWLCRVPVVHLETHEASPRHQELLRVVGPPSCVEAALRLLQRDRPDLLTPAARELPEEGATPAAAAATPAATADASTAATAAATAVSDLLPPPLVPLPCSAEPLASPLPPPPAKDTVMAELEEFLAGDPPPSANSVPPGSGP
ncbi:unnamed protein product [Ixodes persulcatus]